MTDTPVGVAGGLARDGAGAPSRDAVNVQGFGGKTRHFPCPYTPGQSTPVQCFVPGGTCEALSVRFGGYNASYEIWTTEAGFEAIIGSMSAALARYRIACEAGTVEVPEEDIPF
jgi:hypothetical protein